MRGNRAFWRPETSLPVFMNRCESIQYILSEHVSLMKIQEHFGCKLRWFLYLIMMTSAGFPLSSLTITDLGWMEAHVPGDWKLEQLIIAKYHHQGSKRAAEWLLLKPEDETCCRGNVGFLRLTRQIGCRYIDTHCFISSPCLIAHTIFPT